MIEIRTATPADAPALAAITQTVAFRGAAETTGESGFLIGIRTAEEYAALLAAFPGSLVGVSEGRIAGYLLGKPLPDHQAQPALLVDQIALLPEFAGQGLAQHLLDTFRRLHNPSAMQADIVHQPVLNQRSRAFFTRRNGFRLIGEKASSLPGFVLGVYEWLSATEATEGDIHRLIGDDGFARLTGAFYAQVPTDDILGPMYPAHDLDGAEVRLREFLIQRFGGPDRYSQQRGHPRLRGRHAPFAVNRAARDRWVKFMDSALDQAGLPDSVTPVLRRFFHSTATFLRNRPD